MLILPPPAEVPLTSLSLASRAFPGKLWSL
ncbi:hypothetical protein SR1949_34170 [Sphaerospermopsis reniformis]|uniref:Uncharacterized protein n=1 Tax=Sphaerospermopsis reniformis TaxID=531300 RepID=A0A480A3K1_9CYAN|nr:hypothetical protein SR1949_34170 [Sphaerospermopsis reniformis]